MSSSSSPQAKAHILDLMRKLRALPDREYLSCLIAYHAAPTLLGIKPATLICPHSAGRNLEQALDECAPCLALSTGVKMAAFRNRVGALLILVYNPEQLRDCLAADDVKRLLVEAGYDAGETGLDALLRRLAQKCAGREFPHEVGVFLGYPAEDVRDFIHCRGRDCRMRGVWKAYKNADIARQRSDRFRWAKLRAAELLVGGADLGGVVNGLRDSAA